MGWTDFTVMGMDGMGIHNKFTMTYATKSNQVELKLG